MDDSYLALLESLDNASLVTQFHYWYDANRQQAQTGDDVPEWRQTYNDVKREMKRRGLTISKQKRIAREAWA